MPKDKTWRTLIRIHDVNIDGNYCHVIIPGWDVHTKVFLSLDNIPEEIRDLISQGKRFHAKVNIGALSIRDLHFSEWETK